MKRAVSVSLGSSKRDKAVEVELLGEKVSIERIGTDGDMEKAAQMYAELDGKVDAFGVGGADLGVLADKRWYPLYSVKKMVHTVKKTPLVDGTGLKNTLEKRALATFEAAHGDYIKKKHAFIVLGIDRWGFTKSFLDGGYDCVFGDLMFGLDIPIALKSEWALKTMAALAMPIVGRLPFHWVYPTGEKQEKRVPKYHKYFDWSEFIVGDCHYIKSRLPDNVEGKIIITNTTTPEDVELFKNCGIKYLVTATPVLNGRSFGTNMMEAALIAVSGKGRVLTHDELDELIDKIGLKPEIQELI
ncbi:MAG: quinate 5-dehydrogenase [Anaerolineae bacterium]|nr:quinate 5-dehydrogenase [Anaerolineae bacterium]